MCSAIKVGRYTHTKRTQDVMEYRQAQEEKSGSGGDLLETCCEGLLPLQSISPAAIASAVLGKSSTSAAENKPSFPSSPEIQGLISTPQPEGNEHSSKLAQAFGQCSVSGESEMQPVSSAQSSVPVKSPAPSTTTTMAEVPHLFSMQESEEESTFSLMSASSALFALSNSAPASITSDAAPDDASLPWNLPNAQTESRDSEMGPSYTALEPVPLQAPDGLCSQAPCGSKRDENGNGDKQCPFSPFTQTFISLASPSSASSFMDHMLDTMVRGDEVRSDDAPSLSSQSSVSMETTPETSPQHMLLEPSSDLMTDAECEAMTQHILDSHDRLIVSSKYHMSPKEMLLRQQLCYVCQFLLPLYTLL
jgi:hypothetical protein